MQLAWHVTGSMLTVGYLLCTEPLMSPLSAPCTHSHVLPLLTLRQKWRISRLPNEPQYKNSFVGFAASAFAIIRRHDLITKEELATVLLVPCFPAPKVTMVALKSAT